ncbi:MAG: M28 family peptidase [Planctomycetes bacterium]|nr:M28 family peptidase [Planctomycetota bacterium]
MSPRAAPCILLLGLGSAWFLGPAPAQAPQAEPPSQAILRELCETTRLAGTHASLVGARQVARRLEAAGFQVEIVPRSVLLAYPRRAEFAVHEPGAAEPLHERIASFDPDRVPTGDVPLYNAWSASGSVRGPVVDAGRGLRADFERLKAAGVELAGTIALCRYGGSYRGIKADLAARYGCAGVLLWSDPQGDGEARGPTWPAGPWKPGHDAQRGSISPIGRTPGDPSTPGWPSPRPGEPGRRLSAEELAEALPRIPCAPIGSDEARLLLAGLTPRAFVDPDGNVVEAPAGPGPREARIAIESPREVRTIHDVIATLPGASDEFVLAGGHRDAWVRGANDNGSGCVVLIRAAQELGARARAGWTPPRTLKLAFWDAEEFGLIGSTEWAEEQAELLRAKCVAYVNSDVAVSGTRFAGASGTPGMLGLLEPVLRRVIGSAGQPLWDEWLERSPAPRLGLPGSGSDFAVFVHHLNIPYVEAGLSGSGGGYYHTAFDDVAVVERFVDPGYVGHELAARLHVELLSELLARGRDAYDGAEAARRLGEEAHKLAAAHAGAPLGAVADELAAAFQATADALARAPGAGRGFLRELECADGIPGRAWHRNVLWSPGLEDGYGAETFPTLRAAGTDGAGLRAAAAPILDALAGLRRRAETP